EPALELVVVVAVEDVVLAIVLVVDDRLGDGEPCAEEIALGGALRAGAIGEAAPGEISLGKIAVALPAALVDERLQTGAVGARLRAEDAMTGAARGRLVRHPRGFERSAIERHVYGERVDVLGLVERRDGARRRIDEVDEVGKGVAEETG